MTKRLLALAFLTAAVLVGCTTNTVTNITSSTQPRDPKNMYRIEYQWDSTQQTVKPGSIHPLVVVGLDSYEMKPVMKMNNRWEAWIPVPPNKSEVIYHFKVNYEFATFGPPKPGSKLSKEFKLRIE